MVHQYKNNGYNIVLDVNSGSVHVVDDIIYDMIPLYKDFSKGEVDESFYKAAKDLKKGEYTAEPVKSQYGYHIIFKVSSKTNKYEDVKDKIKDDLAEKKLNEDSTLQVSAWDKLRKKYNLKINDTDVKKAYNKIENQR